MKIVYENLKEYNLTKKRRVLIVLDVMIADMESNKKLRPIVTELLHKEENSIFSLFLSHNLILKCLRI